MILRRRIVAKTIGLLALAGCGSGFPSSGGPSDAGSPGADAGHPTVDAGSPAATSTVSGSVKSMPFSVAATSLWLGNPDDPASVVVYVFSKPVTCSDITSMGWDTRITDATQALEMKLIGTTPATYPVATGPNVGQGEASVNYTLTSTSHTPMEQISSGGSVVLSTVVPMSHVTGSFSLNFATESLTGTFNATYCPGGSEP
jgi:hypothetical protein